jgi:hypothetical protein
MRGGATAMPTGKRRRLIRPAGHPCATVGVEPAVRTGPIAPFSVSQANNKPIVLVLHTDMGK